MALADKKITKYKDNVDVSVSELPDCPSAEGYSAETLKKIFYGRTNEEIRNAINGIIDELTSEGAAGQILCEDGKSIQEKLKEGLSSADRVQLSSALEHIQKKDNPHEVTAMQIKMSDGMSVEDKISQQLYDIGVLDDKISELREIHATDISAAGITLDKLKSEVEDGFHDIATYNAATDEIFFDIDENGVISLKPAYRGKGKAELPYSVSDTGAGNDGSGIEKLPERIVIPESINGVAVTGYQPGMFYYNYQVKEIVFADGVKTIPDSFCAEAHQLTSIKNTEHIEHIGAFAFSPTRIKKAMFPSLKTCGTKAFFICSYLTVADIGQIEIIPTYMLCQCLSLVSVYGGENVTTVSDNAFRFTSSLVNAPFLSNGKITSFGKNAFRMSRLQFDWDSLGLTFSSTNYETPIVANESDYWSAFEDPASTYYKAYTPCRNPSVEMFATRNPEWTAKTYLNTTDNHGVAIPYQKCCNIMCIAFIYSCFEGVEFNSPVQFAEEVIAKHTSLNTLDPRSQTAIKTIVEAMGYNDEAHEMYVNDSGVDTGNIFTSEDLKRIYDTLKNGGYVLLNRGGHSIVLYGVNDKGEVLVADSDTSNYMLKEYDMLTYTMPLQHMTSNNNDYHLITKK